jgi:hypothetical protein
MAGFLGGGESAGEDAPGAGAILPLVTFARGKMQSRRKPKASRPARNIEKAGQIEAAVAGLSRFRTAASVPVGARINDRSPAGICHASALFAPYGH